ncbi:hypothetical protein CH063_12500 [Colletotrichum higginsianum]|uniref:Uncharacterized protein n=1 Tax=Colletotrichum higginsianum (strain IMI 349063) TaxID=759273 RepID=H1VQL7_COLHI|nr:hypothetical protein CH063_12500 [Colletotrichum higginsianum]
MRGRRRWRDILSDVIKINLSGNMKGPGGWRQSRFRPVSNILFRDWRAPESAQESSQDTKRRFDNTMREKVAARRRVTASCTIIMWPRNNMKPKGGGLGRARGICMFHCSWRVLEVAMACAADRFSGRNLDRYLLHGVAMAMQVWEIKEEEKKRKRGGRSGQRGFVDMSLECKAQSVASPK